MFTPVLFLVIISHVGERAIVFVLEKGHSIFGYRTLKVSTPVLTQVTIVGSVN